MNTHIFYICYEHPYHQSKNERHRLSFFSSIVGIQIRIGLRSKRKFAYRRYHGAKRSYLVSPFGECCTSTILDAHSTFEHPFFFLNLHRRDFSRRYFSLYSGSIFEFSCFRFRLFFVLFLPQFQPSSFLLARQAFPHILLLWKRTYFGICAYRLHLLECIDLRIDGHLS